MSSTGKIFNTEVREKVRTDRKCENSKTYSLVDRCYRDPCSRGYWDTACKSAQIIAETCTTDCNVLQQLSESSEHTAIVPIQSESYSAVVTTGLWKTTSLLWVVACKVGGWPSHVRRDFCLRWGVLPFYRLRELWYYLHMVDGKSPCSPW
jgi:hypothetical protein